MKTSKTKPRFQLQCEAVSEKTGINVMFLDDNQNSEPCEDDGNLHIIKHGLRACFDVGREQCASGKEQNERTRKVMTELGMEKQITDMVLVDEQEDCDDDECPCCGSPL